MRDVAALAGVSLKTVSRVVNHAANVDPALAAQVRRAVAQLNYRPNLTASSLRRSDGRSLMIGLMLEDVANPFSASLYRAVEDVAVTRDVRILAGSLDENAARERELAAALLRRRVDGLIIVPTGADQGYLRQEQELGTPLVFADRPPRLLAADAVTADNHGGARAAVRHLIGHGHRRIAYLGDLTTIETAEERFAGYREELRDARIDVDPSLIRHDLHTVEAAEAAAGLLLALPEPPTALFGGQNLVTLGCVRALRSAGAQHSVALVGFDDIPLGDLLDPSVTVVAQDPAAIGKLAAEILFSRIDGDRSAPQHHIVPTRLIERSSGALPPVEHVG
jgi:LacI family transcriptional regulator